ncbi:MAG: hypothetical protein QM726_19755 [Chitinophagaceae bacterium]
MIIYGSRGTELAKEYVTAKCPNCNATASIEMHIFQKYAHVFWIPMFPIGKTGVSQCNTCMQVLKPKQMQPSLRESYDNLKAQTKIPIWTFSGIAVIAVLITLGVISDRKKDARNAQLILHPQAGDIFEVRTENNQFTLYKVERTKDDSVFVLLGNYETNKITGLADLKRKGADAYSQEILPLTKTSLRQMLANGEIIDIERKE